MGVGIGVNSVGAAFSNYFQDHNLLRNEQNFKRWMAKYNRKFHILLTTMGSNNSVLKNFRYVLNG